MIVEIQAIWPCDVYVLHYGSNWEQNVFCVVDFQEFPLTQVGAYLTEQDFELEFLDDTLPVWGLRFNGFELDCHRWTDVTVNELLLCELYCKFVG